MCVEDPNFSLISSINQNEDKALRKEEALVDILTFADVKTIKLKSRLFDSLIN